MPTEGLVACDTHVHTLTHSGHGDATLDERAVTLAGEGIELPIATDHDHLTSDLAAAADRMGVSAYFTPVIGDEVTTRTGHFNAFPFAAGTKPPDPNIAGWPDLLRAIRSAPGERVVVLNHPRDLHAGFRPFAPEQFNPVTGEHRRGPLGVDAMEVINSGAMQSDPMQLVRDWMALRNRGERLTAVGASDSHDVARFIVGQGRTYIACRDDDPARLDVDAACRALKAGRALVSLGLLARMSVDDRFGVGDLATKLGEQVEVSVEVHGPSWATADRVELFANGVKVREARIDPSPGRTQGEGRLDASTPAPRRLPGGGRLRAGRDGPLLGHRPTVSADLAGLDFARHSGSPTRSTWTATATAPGPARGPTPRRRSPESDSHRRRCSPRSGRTTRRPPRRPPGCARRPAATCGTRSLPASWRLPPSPSDSASPHSQPPCQRSRQEPPTTTTTVFCAWPTRTPSRRALASRCEEGTVVHQRIG